MRIQHNIAALNSHRQLTSNNSSVAKNLEKLSSGYKINRAGDDAAGLAISEKMRAQITGLNTASKNAQDGISLVQTAEGALTEVHSMLNRMAELADQSANGTYQDDVDRTNIQKEYESLRSEVDRISQGTNFNGIKLLNGTLGDPIAAKLSVSAKVAGVDVAATEVPAVADVFTTGAVTGTAAVGSSMSIAVSYTDAKGAAVSKTITYTSTGTSANSALTDLQAALKADAGINRLFTVGGSTASGISFTAKTAGGKAAFTGARTTGAVTTTIGTTTTAGADAYNTYDMSAALAAGDQIKLGSDTYTYEAGADGTNGKTFGDLAALKSMVELKGKYKVDITNTAAVKFESATAAAGAGQGLKLQIGESSDEFNQLSVKVASMGAADLGIDGLDLGSQSGAKDAIDAITAAINTVSSTRGDLGAIQNRLEHTINNLGVTAENMTAAESRIRDVDMAQEMMNFTKNNILTQASQAMLAQANQLPQGVLQLLQ